jgi:Fic family protein
LIFETNTIGEFKGIINVDDIIETTNHFRCIDFIIEKATAKLSEKLIKEIHFLLKSGTSDSAKDWFNVGEYKKLPNEVGGNETTPPDAVALEMESLLTNYHLKEHKILEDILDFHHQFELIHPFQDGNGRVGRLIIFKECLANDIVPFIIGDDIKFFYYRGLQEWGKVNEYLIDTCLSAQDNYKNLLKYFQIDF